MARNISSIKTIIAAASFVFIRNNSSYKIFFSFTMVIKRSRKNYGESALGDQTASSMSVVALGANSYLRNGFLWIEIRYAKHVYRCS